MIDSAGYKGFNIHTFQWFMIDVCNLSCNYCIQGFGDKEYVKSCNFSTNTQKQNSFKNTLKILNLKNTPKFIIELVGGEPTLHPEFEFIVSELLKIENCISVEVLTNLKSSKKKFLKFNPGDRILINPSIHFEEYRAGIKLDCLELKNAGYSITPTVMLHDKEIYWEYILDFLEFCVNEDINYDISYIYETLEYKYTPQEYGEKFFRLFGDYIKRDARKWPFIIAGKEHLYTYAEIIDKKLNNLRGINCKPLRWVIDYNGDITNGCTKELFLLRNKKESVFKCDIDCCGCEMQWDYEKYT